MTELTGTGSSSDLIAPDDPIRVERARSLLRSAAKAVDEFEEAIRELVAMRAWTVLGYRDLAEMWEGENGFKCPTYAKVLAVEALSKEGMNTHNAGMVKHHGPNGHTHAAVAQAVGIPTYDNGKGALSSPVMVGVLKQLDAGVPADKVKAAGHRVAERNIEEHGRSRGTPRRIGKLPDDAVVESFTVRRRYADAANEWAREMGVPKSEVYRQAVIEFLDRHNINAHFGHASNGATPEVAR